MVDQCDKEISSCPIKEVFEARLEGMDRATTLKAIEIDRRLDQLNELRKEVITDRLQLVNKESYEAWKTVVNDKLTKLMTPYERQPAKPNWTAVVVVAIGILNLFVLVLHYIRG